MDSDWNIVRVDKNVKPWRAKKCKNASQVIEIKSQKKEVRSYV